MVMVMRIAMRIIGGNLMIMIMCIVIYIYDCGCCCCHDYACVDGYGYDMVMICV